MKVITLIQPWASLIALGEKHFETRSWPTKHRGPIAIHAGKKVERDVCLAWPYRQVLAQHGLTADNLPTGAIIATCVLTDCLAIGRTARAADGEYIAMAGDIGISWLPARSNENQFGYFDQGRFAWQLSDVRKLPEPIPAKGQQGFWYFDLEAMGYA